MNKKIIKMFQKFIFGVDRVAKAAFFLGCLLVLSGHFLNASDSVVSTSALSTQAAVEEDFSRYLESIGFERTADDEDFYAWLVFCADRTSEYVIPLIASDFVALNNLFLAIISNQKSLADCLWPATKYTEDEVRDKRKSFYEKNLHRIHMCSNNLAFWAERRRLPFVEEPLFKIVFKQLLDISLLFLSAKNMELRPGVKVLDVFIGERLLPDDYTPLELRPVGLSPERLSFEDFFKLEPDEKTKIYGHLLLLGYTHKGDIFKGAARIRGNVVRGAASSPVGASSAHVPAKSTMPAGAGGGAGAPSGYQMPRSALEVPCTATDSSLYAGGGSAAAMAGAGAGGSFESCPEMETFVKKLEIFFSTRKTPCFSPYSIAKAFFLLALASNDAIFFKIADAFGCGGKSREEATECMKNAVWVKHFAAGAESFFREANVVFSCLDFDDKYLKMLHENLCLGESNIIASKEIFSGVVINRKCSDATHNKIPKICENSSCYNAFILNVLFAEFTWCRPLAPDFQLVFRGMFGDDKQLLTMKSTSSIVKIDPLSGDIYVTMQTREGPVFSLFLPAAGSSSENLFERLDFNKKDLVPHPNSSNIEVILPVFSLNPDILSLADLCAHLGIADLLGVEGVVPGLGALAKIDEMSQAAMMGISLNGFIGAATTLVGYSAKGGQPSLIPPYRIEFNRPFAYQLQHNGSVYFAGFITQGSQLIASAPAREY